MSDLQRGIQLVQQAVQFDANNDIPEAIKLYSAALELFAAALQGEYDDSRRQLIQDKMGEYSNRLRILQDVHAQARGARSATLSTSSSSAGISRTTAPYEQPPSHQTPPMAARPAPYGSDLSGSDGGGAPTRPLPRPGSQVFAGDMGGPPPAGGGPPPVNRTSKPSTYDSGLPPQGSGGASPGFEHATGGGRPDSTAYRSMQQPSGGGGGRGPPPPYGTDDGGFGGHAPMLGGSGGGGGRGAPPPYGMDDGGFGGHAPTQQPSGSGGGRGAPPPYGMDDGGFGGHAPMLGGSGGGGGGGGGGRGAPPPYGMDDGGFGGMPAGDPHMSFQGQQPSPDYGRMLGRSNTVTADIERSLQQGRSASMSQLPPSQNPHMSMMGGLGGSGGSQPSLFASGGGAPDDAQPPIKPIPIHPMLVQFATEFPKEQRNLQAALNIAEVAKQEDKLKHYQAALDLYTDVLERFMLILQGETNPGIRTSLRETMTAYMTRAEQIKDVCKITPHRVADFVPPSSISAARRRSTLFEGGTAPPPGAVVIIGPTTLGRSASMMDAAGAPGVVVIGPSAGPSVQPPGSSARRDPARRAPAVYEMGPPLTNQGDALLPWGTDQEPFDPNPPIPRPVQVSNETKSLLGRQKLILAISVKSNVVLPNDRLTIYIKVDNRSTMVVDSIKISMRRIERMQKFDSKGKNIMTNDVVKVDKQEYFQGGIFPLPAESNYTGEIVYHIPSDLRPTNLFQRGVFEREYDLTVQCQISMRNNLKVRFPVVVDRLR